MRVLRAPGVRRLLWLLLPAALTTAAAAPVPAPRSVNCHGPAVRLLPVCGTKLRDPEISCLVMPDVEGSLRQANNNVRQRASDLFSWQAFVGLHWPVDEGYRGVPDPLLPITAPGPRVWETWKETSEVFRQQDGEPVQPASWGTAEPLPAACGDAAKLLIRDEKVDDALDAVVQPTYADGTLPGTLTDRDRHRVRYEIRMNRVAFEYIVDNRLWDGREQSKAGAVRFPPESQIVKAAWREVDATAAGRFQTSMACVCEEGASGRPTGCRRQLMGLVGFHIMTKTESAPQWIWSTFEQVDNVDGAHPSFKDPGCTSCPLNRQLPAGLPNQVARVIPIPDVEPVCSQAGAAVDNIAQLNHDMRGALRDARTPLQFYDLISTQWPTPVPGALAQPPTVFEAVPALLGNTTLETYIQDTSSCMGCHAVAGTDRTPDWVSADFTFTLNDAWPNPNTTPTNPDPDRVPRTVHPIAPPSRPRTDWDRKNWNQIINGYRIATQTYERMRSHVGSKLHCSSCHLGAGRDPEASWWVGMLAKYGTIEKLYDRINGCFLRSENGSAICNDTLGAGKTPCTDSEPMNALVLYMQWLDEQWENHPDHTSPAPSGFPCLAGPEQLPSLARGASIFLQKCAFCHNREGQGRYESDTYYRPAVWGSASYNAAAGLGTNLEYLAGFIHANMPYGNGGALTAQEAWDVAYFIDQQNRPGKTAGTGQVPSPPIVCPAPGRGAITRPGR